MIIILVPVLLLFLVWYIRRVERGLKCTPKEARQLSPHRWTDEEIKSTYRRISAQPIDIKPHLPPRLDRRYIVVGGSGLVGGSIVLQLLARGQSPESIRIIDCRRARRTDLLTAPGSLVPYVQADISSDESTKHAFNVPWPPAAAHLPLTVFHTAAVIIAEDRAEIFQNRCSLVNHVGTAHVLAAARAAGADIFVATSSGSIAIRPISPWFAPWKSWPDHFVQVYPNPDEDKTIRPREEYSGNYAISKAEAEVVVLRANSLSFRTGALRPACAVYGNAWDMTIGLHARVGYVPSWVWHVIQSFAHMDNVALAHLLYERSLISSPEKVSGKAFLVTDPNPAITFGEMYRILCLLTKFRAYDIPAVPMVILAQLIEWYTLTRATIPLLKWILPPVPGLLSQLQPATMNVFNSHQFAHNTQVEKRVEDGGLGYRGIYSTLEGMCTQIKNWNDSKIHHEAGAVPAAVHAR